MSRYDWDGSHADINQLKEAVEPVRKQVVGHALYAHLDSVDSVRTFMEYHVFAVWDFMSLLKTLQRHLTCVDVPWVPTGTTSSRRLINDIVLVEESDEFDDGFRSHFELYLQAMRETGADTTRIDSFIELLRAGHPVPSALAEAHVPTVAAEYVRRTWEIIEHGRPHAWAAAFAFGREDLIPSMFSEIAALDAEHGSLSRFVEYLRRHIQVDAEEHTPMAMQMLADLCGDDPAAWAMCEDVVIASLRDRIRLWDGILTALTRGEDTSGPDRDHVPASGTTPVAATVAS
jgi:hypothetical protein